MGIVSPSGSVGTIISNVILGTFYDHEGTNGVCYGTKCFHNGFIYLGFVSIAVLVLTIALTFVHYNKKNKALSVQ